MNHAMSRREFESLPLRDDLKGEPVPDAWYRLRGEPSTIVWARCDERSRRLREWWAFKVDIGATVTEVHQRSQAN